MGIERRMAMAPEHIHWDEDQRLALVQEEPPVLLQMLADLVSPKSAKRPPIITEDERRGDSRPVSYDEFHRLASLGRQKLDVLHKNASPITGLDNQWDAIKAHAYGEAMKPWGGATIDAHTGVPVQSNAERWALTVKPPGMHSFSVPENPSQEEFNRTMDEAKEAFRPHLQNQQYHLGVFHDDDLHRVDIDPVLVVDNHDDVEQIGAHTHAIGGAYKFSDGNGYWPPHVPHHMNPERNTMGEEHEAQKKEADQNQPDFKGPGHWRSQAEEIQPGYDHKEYMDDDEDENRV